MSRDKAHPRQYYCWLLFITLGVWEAQAEPVVFSKLMVHPRSKKPAYIEIYNPTATPYDIARWRLKGGVHFEFPVFSVQDPRASFLRPFERLVVSAANAAETRTAYGAAAAVRIFGPWQGGLGPGEQRITLADKNGADVCTVKYTDREPWPSSDDSAGHAWVLIDPDRKVDDWRNWAMSARADEALGVAPLWNQTSPMPSPEIEAIGGTVLVDYHSAWRFNDAGQNLAAAWRAPAFDDRNWRTGPGLLGWDDKPLPGPGLRTRVRFNRQITYYFRFKFAYAGDIHEGDRLVLDQVLDDGAVYYLNGSEIGRSRMPVGPIHYLTLTTSTVPTASEELNILSLDPHVLVSGTNVLAVEVHQCAPASSDIVFGMRLRLVPMPRAGVVINELGTDAAGRFIEFCNTADQAANLKGYGLSDDLHNLRKHSFTNDCVLPSKGLAAIDLAACGLGNTDLFSIYLAGPNGQTVLNAVTVNFAEDGRAIGRGSDGQGAWFRLADPSRGQPNPTRAMRAFSGSSNLLGTSDVVINEIMYDPPFGAEGSEFLELYNRGAGPMDVSGWRLSEGITFDFPAGSMVAPGGYLVLAAHRKQFRKVYGDIPIAGAYQGRLRHGGERLRLVDAAGHVADEVDFKAEGDWPILAHGGGSSMELLNPWMDNARSSAWRDSDESPKAAWQTYGCTNVYQALDAAGGRSDYRELHLYLAGEGRVALRKIGLWKDGINFLDHPERLANGPSSADGWLAQGTHGSTFMTNGELHIIADGRGDNKADRVAIGCARIQRGERYELRFEGRWLAGCPRLIALTWDHSFGGSFLLALPKALGTPGQPNSVATKPPLSLVQAGPQLDDLMHFPPVPRSTDTVKLSAKIHCASPLASVQLFHRPDSPDGNARWLSKPMITDTNGSCFAELDEYRTNRLVVQFYVRAVGANGQSVTLPRPGASAPALWVVDDQKPPRDLRLERFIVSAYDLESMVHGNTAKYGYRQPRLSNHRYNMTYISNEERVFYGGSIRISGSPFTRGSELTKGKWDLPEDRMFRGRTKFYFDNDSNYHNRLCRYLLYQLGHAAADSEWVRVVINSSSAYLKEETEPMTSEFLERHFPNGNRGELYRIDDEWWFAENWQRQNRDADWQYKGTDDPARYRSEWQKKTRAVEDDYSALIAFFKTYSDNRYTQDAIERMLDPEATLEMAAVRGYICDWDSFTMFRGKNGYFYRRPEDGRFQFLQWDSDLAFRDANYPLYSERVATWMEKPYNQKRFQEYLAKLVAFSQSPQLATWFDVQRTACSACPPTADFYQAFFRRRNQVLPAIMGQTQALPQPSQSPLLRFLRSLTE